MGVDGRKDDGRLQPGAHLVLLAFSHRTKIFEDAFFRITDFDYTIRYARHCTTRSGVGVLEEGFRMGSGFVYFGQREAVFYTEILHTPPTGSKGLTVPFTALVTVPPRVRWGARGGVLNGGQVLMVY